MEEYMESIDYAQLADFLNKRGSIDCGKHADRTDKIHCLHLASAATGYPIGFDYRHESLEYWRYVFVSGKQIHMRGDINSYQPRTVQDLAMMYPEDEDLLDWDKDLVLPDVMQLYAGNEGG